MSANAYHSCIVTEVIEDLGLQGFIGVGIKVDDVLNCKMDEGPLAYLKRLVMGDFTGRDTFVPTVKTLQSAAKHSLVDDLFDADVETVTPNKINPVDYITLLYNLCETNLLYLVTKQLSKCRLAVPIVIPNYKTKEWEILSDCLLSVYFDWIDAEGLGISGYALYAPCNLVAFCRLGDVPASKSMLLNRMLDSEVHPTFAHYEGINSSGTKIVSNGMIEGSWFLPGQKKLYYKNLTLFLNMHGDARSKDLQILRDTLLKHMHVLVILTTSFALREAIESGMFGTFEKSASVIFLIVAEDHATTRVNSGLDKIIETFVKMKLEEGFSVKACRVRQRDMTTVVSSNLNKIVGDELVNKPLKCFSSFCTSENFLSRPWRVKVDNRAKAVAPLFDLNTSDNWSSLVPTLYNLWPNYVKGKRHIEMSDPAFASTDEEKNNGLTNYFESDVISELDGVDTTAFANIQNPSGMFTDSVFRLYGQYDTAAVICFLKHVHVYLAEQKSTALSLSYRHLKQLVRTKITESEREAHQNEIKDIYKNIYHLSFDVGHLLREWATFYELSDNRTEEILKLPELGAKILIDGYPLELLDGDQSMIPIEWIQDLFTKVSCLTGDGKVFIIAILGVQSSGKSTLLNTLFGLYFPVSVGRCTRGVNMQLMKIKNDIPSDSQNYDYILVLDTEGVKAVERGDDSVIFDNELAMLVIAAADLVLVNVKGENYASMKDLLEIATHAFWRLSQVNYNRKVENKRCMFLHQNVSAADAKAKNASSSAQLELILNSITAAALKDEGFSPSTKLNFNALLAFDPDEDVWYFPDMWCGSPPMGYINPAYSRRVLELREHILSLTQPSYLQLSDIGRHIGDIWSSIMSKNFVTSFKNSIELQSYFKVERISRLCRSELDNLCLELEQMWRTASCRCRDDKGIQAAWIGWREELEDEKVFLKQSIEYQFKALCDEEWHLSHIETQARALQDNLYDETDDKLAKLIKAIESTFQNFEEELGDTNLLIKCIDEYAKGANAGQEVNELPNKIYEIWKIQAVQNARRISPTALEQNIKKSLLCTFPELQQFVLAEFEYRLSIDRNMTTSSAWLLELIKLEDIEREFVSLNTIPLIDDSDDKQSLAEPLKCIENRTGYTDNEPSSTLSSLLNEMWSMIRNDVVYFLNSNVIQSLRSRIEDFESSSLLNPAAISTIVENVRTQCENKTFTVCMPETKVDVTIQLAMAVRIAVKLCNNLYASALNSIGETNEHIEQRLNRIMRREVLFQQLFTDFITKENTEEMLANYMSAILKCAIISRVKKVLPTRIDGILMEEYDCKQNVMQEVLLSLIETKGTEYSRFASFLENAMEFSRTWLKDKIIQAHLPTLVPQLFKEGCTLLEDTIDRFRNMLALNAVSFWNHAFLEMISQLFPVSAVDFLCDLVIQDIDVSKFISSLKRKLKTIVFSTLYQKGYHDLWIGDDVFNDTFVKIWGCTALCPLCLEPCSHRANHRFEKKSTPHVSPVKTHDINHECHYHRPVIFKVRKIHADYKHTGYLTCNLFVARRENRFLYRNHYHRFQNYKKYFDDWYIKPALKYDRFVFWHWFIAKFKEVLSKNVDTRKYKFPSDWDKVTVGQAKHSLAIVYSEKGTPVRVSKSPDAKPVANANIRD